jgi:hypothetical protein
MNTWTEAVRARGVRCVDVFGADNAGLMLAKTATLDLCAKHAEALDRELPR